MEITYITFNRWMGKESWVYVYWGVLFCQKKNSSKEEFESFIRKWFMLSEIHEIQKVNITLLLLYEKPQI